MSLLIFGGLMAVMWAVLILPQQKKAKAQRAMLNSLAEGDLVLTASGIYGVITELTDAAVYIEVAQGIELKMTRSSIAGKVQVVDEDADSAAPAKDGAVKSDEGSRVSGIAKVLGLNR